MKNGNAMPAKISVCEVAHPRYTHRVRYPGPDGKRIQRFFTNITEANKFAAEREKEFGVNGTAFGSVSGAEKSAIEVWRNFVKEAATPPPDLLSVVQDFAKKWNSETGSVTVAEALEKYLAHQEADGASPRHLSSLRSRIGRLVADKGESLVVAIDEGVFSDWLNGLRGTRHDKVGAKLTLVTRDNLKRTCRGFFAYCMRRGWTLSNPVPVAARKRTKAHRLATHKAPAIMTPAEVSTFLHKVQEVAHEILPLWAFKFFAGIRDAEAMRMSWEMVDLKEGKISLPAEITKTGHERSVKIEPALAAWIAPYAKKAGPVVSTATTARYYYKKVLRHLRKPEKKGGKPRVFVFPSNAARHSFGTYHLYAFQDAGKTSLQLGHKGDPKMLWSHYANPSAEKHAEAFWAIRPATPGNVVPMDQSADTVEPKAKNRRAAP